jgi:hypothetical protein
MKAITALRMANRPLVQPSEGVRYCAKDYVALQWKWWLACTILLAASDNIQLYLCLPCIQEFAGGNIYFSNIHGTRLGTGGNKNVIYTKTCSNSKQRRQFSSTIVISVIPLQGVVSFSNLWMLRSEPRNRITSCERRTTKCVQINMHHNKVMTTVPSQKFVLNWCEHSTYSGILVIRQ